MPISQTNVKVSQHRPMEFDSGLSINFRNKTKQNATYNFLWNTFVFEVREHCSNLHTHTTPKNWNPVGSLEYNLSVSRV